MASNVELLREVIALARQGGLSLREIREARTAAWEEAQEKAKKAGGGKKPQKSQSTPSLTATSASATNGAGVRPSMGTRRGGGWATQWLDAELTKFKEKLAEVQSRGLDVDYREKPYKRTALWEATWKNHEAIVRLLAAKGANIAIADFQGRTPLHEAAYYGHASIMQFLLDSGHPVNIKDIFGQTPLFRAAEGGRFDLVKMLVDRGANTNLVDKDNCTVQHIAAFNGFIELSHYLVHKGAVKNRLNLDGFHDLDLPSLSSSGRDFSSTGRSSRTPLKTSAAMMFGEMRKLGRTRSAAGLDLAL